MSVALVMAAAGLGARLLTQPSPHRGRRPAPPSSKPRDIAGSAVRRVSPAWPDSPARGPATPSSAAPELSEANTALLLALEPAGTRAAIIGVPGSGRRHAARSLAALLRDAPGISAQVVRLDASRGFTDLALQWLAWLQAHPDPVALSEGESLRELLRRHGSAPGGDAGVSDRPGSTLLLVLENLPCGEEGQALERLIAEELAPRCRRLLTQSHSSESSGASLRLAGLPEEQALAMVRGPHPLVAAEEEALRALVLRTGALPLALTWLARVAPGMGPTSWSRMLEHHRAVEAEALAPVPPRSPLAEAPGCAALLLTLWRELPVACQRLGLLLGAMAAAPVPLALLERCAALAPEIAPQAGLSGLEQAGWVTVTPAAAGHPEQVEVHALVHAFLKAQRRSDAAADGPARTTVLAALGQLAHEDLPAGLAVAERLPLAPLLPHWREVVSRDRHGRPEAELLWPVLGIGRLLEGLEGDEDSRLLQACLEICEGVLGPDHPDTAIAMLNLAAFYESGGTGDARAEALLLRALTLRRACFGDAHPATTAVEERLGLVLAARGEREQAIPLLEGALTKQGQRLGGLHPDLLGPLTRLMGVQEAHGAYARAEGLGQRILQIQEHRFGEDHPERATILQRLGQLQELQGSPQRAEAYYRSALSTRRRHQDPNEAGLAPLLARLGSLALERGEPELAEQHLREALALGREEQPEAGRWLQDLARVQQVRGQMAEAEHSSREAVTLLERTIGPWHPQTASALNALAWLLSQKRESAEAQVLCERALAIRRRSLGSHHLETASSLNTLAALHEQLDAAEEALPLYQEALDITETQLGPDHPATRTVRANLRSCGGRLNDRREAS